MQFEFFTDLNNRVDVKQCEPIDVVVAHLRLRQLKLNGEELQEDVNLNTPIYEWISEEKVFTKAYFDIDAPKPYFAILEKEEPTWETFLDAAVECFHVSPSEVSVCETLHADKLSFHITINRQVDRDTAKAARKLFSSFLIETLKLTEGFDRFVDKQVYGKTQKWRTVFTSKRNLQKFKLLRHGTITDTFVTVVGEEKLIIPTPTRHLPPTTQSPPSRNLAYFEAALNDLRLSNLWEQKRQSYDNWQIVGQSCYVESKRNNCLPIGLQLFIKFSGNNPQEATRKFETAFQTCNNDMFNKIKSWVREYKPEVHKELLHHTKETRPRTIVLDEPTDEESDYIPEVSPIRPTNRRQYIIAYHIRKSKKLHYYWKSMIEKNGWIPLIGLTQTGEALEARKQEALEQFGFNTPTKLFPFPEFCFANCTDFDEEFYHHIAQLTELEYRPVNRLELVESDVSTTFRNYMRIAERTDFTVYTESLDHEYVAPCSEFEKRDYQHVIKTIALADEESLWLTQFPYKQALNDVCSKCMKNGTVDWDLFWLVFSRVCSDILALDKVFHYISNVTTDADAAEVVINLYPFFRLSTFGQIYCFDDTMGYWSVDPSIKMSTISRFECLLQKKEINFGKDAKKRANVLSFIETAPAIKEKGSRAFEESMYSSRGRLLFRNGMYDGINQTFVPKEDLVICDRRETFFKNQSIMFFGKIDNDYRPRTEEEEEMFVDMKNVYFLNMHGEEIGNYWRKCLSLILFGMPFKGFFEHIGDTHAGKSSELDMILFSFNDYYGTQSTSVLEYHKLDSRPVDRQNGWVVDCWHKRMIGFSEIGEITAKMNTNRVKSIASGGTDPIPASKLYRDSCNYAIMFVMVWYINRALEFDDPKDPALANRRNTINWYKQYTTANDYDPMLQMRERTEVQTWAKCKQRQLLFNHLIIEAFAECQNQPIPYRINKPESMTVFVDDADQTFSTEDLMELLLTHVVITGNPIHFIKASDFSEIIEKKMGFLKNKTLVTIKAYLQTLNVGISSMAKKILGQKTQIWCGLELRPTAMAPETSMLIDLQHWKQVVQRYNGNIPKEVYDKLALIEQACHSTWNPQLDEDLLLELGSPAQINHLTRVLNLKRRRLTHDE